MTRRAATGAGVERIVDACIAGCAWPAPAGDPAEARRATRAWWSIGLGAVLAANSMMFGLAVNVSDPTPAARAGLHWALLGATLAALALLAPTLLRAAWLEARRGRLTIEFLFLTCLAGAFGASLQSMLSGQGPVYFETVIVLLVVYRLGHELSGAARRRAVRALEAWAGLPERCELIGADGAAEDVPVAAIGPGDLVRVHPGRAVPVDGLVAEGEALVRQAQVTGEAFAEPRRAGDPVWAGSHCLDGTLLVRATAAGNGRRIDAIAGAVERARATPSRLEREADRLTRWFLPLVLALALATLLGWSLASGWRIGLFHALSVLLVACPCAMGFATPLALGTAIARLAERGVLLTRGTMLEALAQVDTVVFDKTGTLTRPRPRLADFVVAPEFRNQAAALRGLIAAVQRATDHPLAEAFAEWPAAAGWELALRPLPGRGVTAHCTHNRAGALPMPAGIGAMPIGIGAVCQVTLGNESLLESPDQRAAWDALAPSLRAAAGARWIVVLIEGAVAAAAAIEEAPEPGGEPMLAALGRAGPRRILMTGDAPERAEALAGFDEIWARQDPEAKAARVRRLRADGRRVLMIGDGLNDAAALAEADASLAIADGTPLARDVAGGILAQSDLAALPWALSWCRGARAAIRRNLAWAAAYNVIGMSVAAAGLLHPVTAALLMTCSSLIVTWRALAPLESEARESAAAPPPARPAMPLPEAPAT